MAIVDNGNQEIDLKVVFNNFVRRVVSNYKLLVGYFLFLTILTIVFFVVTKQKYSTVLVINSPFYSINKIIPTLDNVIELSKTDKSLLVKYLRLSNNSVKDITDISYIIVDDQINLIKNATLGDVFNETYIELELTTKNAKSIDSVCTSLLNYINSSPYISYTRKLDLEASDNLIEKLKKKSTSLDSLNILFLKKFSSNISTSVYFSSDISVITKEIHEIDQRIYDLEKHKAKINKGIVPISEIIPIEQSNFSKILSSLFKSLVVIIFISFFHWLVLNVVKNIRLKRP